MDDVSLLEAYGAAVLCVASVYLLGLIMFAIHWAFAFSVEFLIWLHGVACGVVSLVAAALLIALSKDAFRWLGRKFNLCALRPVRESRSDARRIS